MKRILLLLTFLSMAYAMTYNYNAPNGPLGLQTPVTMAPNIVYSPEYPKPGDSMQINMNIWDYHFGPGFTISLVAPYNPGYETDGRYEQTSLNLVDSGTFTAHLSDYNNCGYTDSIIGSGAMRCVGDICVPLWPPYNYYCGTDDFVTAAANGKKNVVYDEPYTGPGGSSYTQHNGDAFISAICHGNWYVNGNQAGDLSAYAVPYTLNIPSDFPGDEYDVGVSATHNCIFAARDNYLSFSWEAIFLFYDGYAHTESISCPSPSMQIAGISTPSFANGQAAVTINVLNYGSNNMKVGKFVPSWGFTFTPTSTLEIVVSPGNTQSYTGIITYTGANPMPLTMQMTAYASSYCGSQKKNTLTLNLPPSLPNLVPTIAAPAYIETGSHADVTVTNIGVANAGESQLNVTVYYCDQRQVSSCITMADSEHLFQINQLAPSAGQTVSTLLSCNGKKYVWIKAIADNWNNVNEGPDGELDNIATSDFIPCSMDTCQVDGPADIMFPTAYNYEAKCYDSTGANVRCGDILQSTVSWQATQPGGPFAEFPDPDSVKTGDIGEFTQLGVSKILQKGTLTLTANMVVGTTGRHFNCSRNINVQTLPNLVPTIAAPAYIETGSHADVTVTNIGVANAGESQLNVTVYYCDQTQDSSCITMADSEHLFQINQLAPSAGQTVSTLLSCNGKKYVWIKAIADNGNQVNEGPDGELDNIATSDFIPCSMETCQVNGPTEIKLPAVYNYEAKCYDSTGANVRCGDILQSTVSWQATQPGGPFAEFPDPDSVKTGDIGEFTQLGVSKILQNGTLTLTANMVVGTTGKHLSCSRNINVHEETCAMNI